MYYEILRFYALDPLLYSLCMEESEHEAAEQEVPRQKQSHRRARSQYWLFWLLITVLGAVTMIMGQAPNLLGAILTTLGVAGYTYYLYRGGSFVLKPKWWVMLLILAVPLSFFFDFGKVAETSTVPISPSLSPGTVKSSNNSSESEPDPDADIQKKYPLIAKLPYRTSEYTITYTQSPDDAVFFTVDFDPPNAVGDPGSDSFNDWIAANKKQALKFMKDNGVDSSKDTVIFKVWGAQDF